MDQFVFTFQLPSVYSSLPPTPTPASSNSPGLPSPLVPLIATSRVAPNPHAAAQARYRTRNSESERDKARERMRKRRRGRSPVTEDYTSTELRAMSSKDLRASRTFAGFRDYVRDYMFWVVIDEDNPEEVTAYNRFMRNNTPSDPEDLTDEDVEFLFRHIYPEPQGVDVEG
ncbi:hypothetical protein C8R46DRAFT_1033136 [Mycena filopes]|nr:hypothetical protein C8R46DRAFT_1033136 [Mycena filopes]